MSPSLSTDAIVLQRHPPSERFQRLALFSPTEGNLTALQRITTRKNAPEATPADLFDELQLRLETGRQGGTLWFVKESRLTRRHIGIGRNYEALRFASELAMLVLRNPVSAESLAPVYTLLQQAFAAFGTGTRPDVVAFKSLYCFARDEGYPLKQQWLPTLSTTDRDLVVGLLGKPLIEQTADLINTARLHRGLGDYLSVHTELQLTEK